MTKLTRPEGEKYLYSVERGQRRPEIGTTHKVDHGHSQFCGSWTYRITRVTELGDVFGVYHSGDVFELDIEDCV